MKFADLEFTSRSYLQGVVARVFFPNGYGASVIRGTGTYGAELGLYELAVLAGTEEDFRLCYTTPITDGVVGYLSEDRVSDLLEQIEALPARTD